MDRVGDPAGPQGRRIVGGDGRQGFHAAGEAHLPHGEHEQRGECRCQQGHSDAGRRRRDGTEHRSGNGSEHHEEAGRHMP